MNSTVPKRTVNSNYRDRTVCFALLRQLHFKFRTEDKRKKKGLMFCLAEFETERLFVIFTLTKLMSDIKVVYMRVKLTTIASWLFAKCHVLATRKPRLPEG